MAEPLKPSRQNEKPSTKQTKTRTTVAEAAALITSALGYCLDAGLVVEGYNESGVLILEIHGLEYADEQVTPVTPVTLPTGVTGVTEVTP
jgi:hypothetical protein